MFPSVPPSKPFPSSQYLPFAMAPKKVFPRVARFVTAGPAARMSTEATVVAQEIFEMTHPFISVFKTFLADDAPFEISEKNVRIYKVLLMTTINLTRRYLLIFLSSEILKPMKAMLWKTASKGSRTGKRSLRR